MSLEDFNLILGDNAQGKTRLFNVLSFLHDIHVGTRKLQNPEYRGECRLLFVDDTDRISYELELEGLSSGLVFKEIIRRNEKILFDRSKGLLINESTGESVDKFFLPDTAPVTASVKEDTYPTINSLQSFFERMLFLQANRFAGNNIFIDTGALILNPTGSNVGSVMTNWREKRPSAYQEVVDSFKANYSFIQEVSVKETELPNGIRAPVLSMKEKGIEMDIEQVNWSDGLLRSICLFALPCTQFQENSAEIVRPSFICVDEIENGLDFRTLSRVIEHYDAYSNLIQVAITTHSPLVCNLVEPTRWRVMKRKGPVVRAFAPENVEDLDEVRQKLGTDNWEFYRRHISQSKHYSAH